MGGGSILSAGELEALLDPTSRSDGVLAGFPAPGQPTAIGSRRTAMIRRANLAVSLERFRPGPFVLPAAVLNALPKGRSYTVDLVSGGDMSDCSFDYVSSQLHDDFPIADLLT